MTMMAELSALKPKAEGARRVGILIFDEVEVLDFAGPFEVFSVTCEPEPAASDATKPFDVSLIGLTGASVLTVGGMQVTPAWTLASCPKLDILVIPGGWGTRRLIEHAELRAWLQARAQEVELLTSVCTGSLLLAAAGLLDGRRATTHWKALDTLAQLRPAVMVVRDQHVVEEGTTLTSAGISAGIDMALRVVARLCGEAVARATAQQMEYAYPESNARRVDAGVAG